MYAFKNKPNAASNIPDDLTWVASWIACPKYITNPRHVHGKGRMKMQGSATATIGFNAHV